MDAPVPIPATAPAEASGPDAEASDARLVAMWLHGRAFHTTRVYRRDVARFRAFVGKALREVTLGDLQAFADTLVGAESSRGRVMASVRSLFSLAAKLGAIPFNIAAAMRRAKTHDTLPDRIIDESDVAKMLALTAGRDHAFVRLLYASACRVAEITGLRWVDLADASDGGLFVTVHGKGGKTRVVRVSAATAKVVRALQGDAPASAYVFAGRRGRLDPSQAWRIVRAVARRAGIERCVSPHWLRHAHATHALDRGARITLVRDTLGHASLSTTDRYAHARPQESSGLVLPV